MGFINKIKFVVIVLLVCSCTNKNFIPSAARGGSALYGPHFSRRKLYTDTKKSLFKICTFLNSL
jgi:hypothetical protein